MSSMAAPAPGTALHPPASQRALAVPEILQLILRNLERDQADFPATSLVSKLWCAVSRPLMLQDLDVPLSKAPRFVASFGHRRSRHLLQHVKRLRVWDDQLHQQLQASRIISIWSEDLDAFDRGPGHKFTDPRWSDHVADLFDLFTTASAGKTTLPLLDMSVSFTSTAAASRMLAEFPAFAKQLVALQITGGWLVTNVDEPTYEGEDLDHITDSFWVEMACLVESIANVQQADGNARLKTFALSDIGWHSNTPRFIYKAIWDSLRENLKDIVEDLSIDLTAGEDAHSEGYGALLSKRWECLRRVRIRLEDSDNVWASSKQILNDFLTRQPELEEIIIDAHHHSPVLKLTQSFPDLKRLALSRTYPSILRSFLQRHPSLSDLSVLHLDPHEEEDDDDDEEMRDVETIHLKAERLQALTCHADDGSFFLGGAAALKTLEIASLYGLDHLVDLTKQWRNEGASDLRSVTGLRIRLSAESFFDTIAQLGYYLHPSSYPNLAELNLVCKNRYFVTSHTRLPPSVAVLRQILFALRGVDTLRVLHVEDRCFGKISADSIAHERLASALPPKLEYLTWRAGAERETQHFRVVRLHESTGTESAQLQSLPARWRSSVNDAGVWRREREWATMGTDFMLDHTVSPPRFLL